MFYKKLLIILTIVLAAILAIGGYFWFKKDLKPEVEVDIKIKKDVMTSDQKSVLESEIDATKKQLEELSRLTSEEIKKREDERKILTAQDVASDIPVKGVEILTKDGIKIIRNIAEGYRIEIPVELIIARTIKSDLIEIHDPRVMCKEDPSCDPIIRIRASPDNLQKLDLEKWFKAEEEKAGSEIYSPRERVEVGDEVAFRITENIPGVFDGYYYYWSRGAKIYYLRVSAFDEGKYGEFIETFTFE